MTEAEEVTALPLLLPHLLQYRLKQLRLLHVDVDEVVDGEVADLDVPLGLRPGRCQLFNLQTKPRPPQLPLPLHRCQPNSSLTGKVALPDEGLEAALWVRQQ